MEDMKLSVLVHFFVPEVHHTGGTYEYIRPKIAPMQNPNAALQFRHQRGPTVPVCNIDEWTKPLLVPMLQLLKTRLLSTL